MSTQPGTEAIRFTACDDGALHAEPLLRRSGAEPSVRVLGAGDWASCRCYADAAERTPQDLYGPTLAEVVAAADLAIVNLECTLADGPAVTKEGPNLRGTPASAQALRAAGFHVASLGNNHTMDYGLAALTQTQDLCRAAGLATVGAGRDRAEALAPHVVERNGVRIGVLAVADPEDGVADAGQGGVASAFDPGVLPTVGAMRDTCDVSVVLVHGGREYVPVPSLYWYDQVCAIARAGADLVIGHHPHVPQGGLTVPRAGGGRVPILFSTGNFIFRPALPDGIQIAPYTAAGYIVEADCVRGGVTALRLRPYGMDGGNGVRALTTNDARRAAQFLNALSEPLAERERVAAWFDAVVAFQWSRHYRERFIRFNRLAWEGDVEGLRFARSHHRSNAHRTLIDHALARAQAGCGDAADPRILRKLEAWYAGDWPARPFGRPIADPPQPPARSTP